MAGYEFQLLFPPDYSASAAATASRFIPCPDCTYGHLRSFLTTAVSPHLMLQVTYQDTDYVVLLNSLMKNRVVRLRWQSNGKQAQLK